MNTLTIVFALFCLAVAFIVGALSVHAYPKFDWEIGQVHDFLRELPSRYRALRDRVKSWWSAKKARV